MITDTVSGSDAGLTEGFFAEPETFYRNVLDSLSEAVFITDPEWRIRYVNRLVPMLSGYSLDELLGRTVFEVLQPHREAHPSECQSKRPLSDEVECFEAEIKLKDGHLHWVFFKKTPYRNDRGEVVGTVVTASCIARQKNLELENELLHDELRANFGNILGRSPALQKVLSQISTVAPTDANVLVLGESGTGKELVARAVHDLSARKDHPLVRVNCASIPKELFESEFFGHVRGAFTGAIKERAGRFELADGGTLFLDEIGEIPLDLQSKLLRVLQEGQFERVGDDRTRTVRVRLIAATNRNLLAEVKAGRFRQDLYYRLSVFPIELPPLRERSEDIGLLAEHFLQQAARRLGTPRLRLTKLHVQELQNYDWPGNVRELQNVVERAAILARDGKLQFDLPRSVLGEQGAARLAEVVPDDGEGELSLDELAVREREIVSAALHRRKWKIYGADGAAALLKVKPTTLVSMMKRLRIERPEAV